MKVLRQAGFTRSTVLVLLLGALAFSLITLLPENVNACGFESYWTYYSEPEMVNEIGACYSYCGGPGGCWGSTSEYRNGYSVECPCWP